jgi:hypothetical protein
VLTIDPNDAGNNTTRTLYNYEKLKALFLKSALALKASSPELE